VNALDNIVVEAHDSVVNGANRTVRNNMPPEMLVPSSPPIDKPKRRKQEQMETEARQQFEMRDGAVYFPGVHLHQQPTKRAPSQGGENKKKQSNNPEQPK
jgi:hypothetical protein